MSHLEALFTPRSIAVVGVTENPEKLGHLLLKNIVDFGFMGEVYPVCATGGEVMGRKAYASIRDIKAEVDLVLVTVPNREAVAALKDAAKLRPRVLAILSSGFGETGLAGKKIEREIHAIFQDGTTRVMGPNCRGVLDAHHRLNATFYRDVPRSRGNISFVTQSGSYGALLFNEVRQRGLGISRFASIGNQLDLEPTDFLEALGADEHTDVIGLFVEEIKDGSRFVQVAAEISLKKPIVVFKAGRTPAGSKVAEAHTGSQAGSVEVFEAAARQAGILLTHDTEQFFDQLAVLSSFARNLPASESVGVLGVSGGPSVTIADVCEEVGLRLAPLEPATRKAIRALIPEAGADANPVDMTPEIDPENFVPCVDAFLGDKNVAGCIAIDVGLDRPEFARAFVEGRNRHSKPVVAFAAGAPEVAGALVRSGICVYPSPERAVRAYQALVAYRKMLEVQKRKGIIARTTAPTAAVPAVVPGRSGKVKATRIVPLGEVEAKALLRECGVPVIGEMVIKGARDAAQFLKSNGYPLTLRALDARPARGDRAEAIGGIGNRRQLDKAVSSLRRKAGKSVLLLQRHVQAEPCALQIAVWRDPVFGCAVRCGLAGVFAEILRDVAVRVCPIRRTDAEGMLQEVRGHALLDHALAAARVDSAQLADVTVRVSELILARPEIAELVLDPVVLCAGEVLVLSAHGAVVR